MDEKQKKEMGKICMNIRLVINIKYRYTIRAYKPKI